MPLPSPLPVDDAPARIAWNDRVRAFNSSLPACPAEMPAISVEVARAHRWRPGECVLVRGWLHLFAEKSPCFDSDGNPRPCRVAWMLRTAAPTTPPGASASSRIAIMVWNGAGHDATGACESQTKGERWLPPMLRASLPYPTGVAAANVPGVVPPELAVSVLGALPSPDHYEGLPFSDSPQFPPLDVPADYSFDDTELEVTHLCRQE